MSRSLDMKEWKGKIEQEKVHNDFMKIYLNIDMYCIPRYMYNIHICNFQHDNQNRSYSYEKRKTFYQKKKKKKIERRSFLLNGNITVYKHKTTNGYLCRKVTKSQYVYRHNTQQQ